MIIEKIPISEINPASYNPRSISKKALQGLKNSLKTFGYVEPIIYNQRTKNIVGGHQRFSILKESSEKEIECVIVDLDDVQERALNVSLNNKHISGDWDVSGLADVLASLETHIDFEELNFDDLLEELNLDFGKTAEGLTDPDEVPELGCDPIIKLGDLIELGDHRLLCGDCTKLEDVEKLMVGKKADMVFTDPPYRVSYEGKTKDKLKIKNDSLDKEELADLFFRCCDSINFACRGGAYLLATVPAGQLHIIFVDEWNKRGWLRQIMVWVKDSMVLGHSEYHYRHEPILFGWKEGDRLKSRDRKKTTVWEFARPKRSTEHLTMKPVEMWEFGIKTHTKKSDILFEPFSGSGTTFIACQKTDRKCYGIEIDPHYCDVIVERWCNFTGIHDIKINSVAVKWTEDGIKKPYANENG